MKKIFLVFSFAVIYSFPFSQAIKYTNTAKSQIYVIGVIHNENENRNADSLLNILKYLKPDLILSETDTVSGYFKSGYKLVKPPRWYKLARKLNAGRKMPPEMDVLYKYREINNSVLIYPFDITIKNRKNYVNTLKVKEKEWILSLNSSFSNNQIPDSILSFHKEYIGFNNWVLKIIQHDYYFINRTIVTDSIRQMIKLEEEYFPKLINSVQNLSEYKSWYNDNLKYWDLRNEVMTKNIIDIVEKSASKKVVVFTGLLHKYYLVDLLNAYNTQKKYEIVEF